MKSSLRNKLSDLKVIIIDEISMVSNDLLFHVHLQLTEIFGSANDQPFAGVSVITVGHFFSVSTCKRKTSICKLKTLNIYCTVFKKTGVPTPC